MLAVAAGGVYSYNEKQKAARIQGEMEARARQKLTKETDAISVDITYPIIPENGEYLAKTASVNAEIREGINKRISTFEKDANENVQLGMGLPQEVKSTVTGSPSLRDSSERYVSLFMGIEWYLRGAAHPSHTIDTYVYDYEKGALVGVSEFFKPGSAYLERLSVLAKEDLVKQSMRGDLGYVYDENIVNEGTFPIKENFARMLPMKDGLAIYFNEYQVAPYAAGPQQVMIPYAKLQDIIDPHGVLGAYIKK